MDVQAASQGLGAGNGERLGGQGVIIEYGSSRGRQGDGTTEGCCLTLDQIRPRIQRDALSVGAGGIQEEGGAVVHRHRRVGRERVGAGNKEATLVDGGRSVVGVASGQDHIGGAGLGQSQSAGGVPESAAESTASVGTNGQSGSGARCGVVDRARARQCVDGVRIAVEVEDAIDRDIARAGAIRKHIR